MDANQQHLPASAGSPCGGASCADATVGCADGRRVASGEVCKSGKKLKFDSNLPGLLNEILSNPTCAILKLPVNITKGILAELAQLAIEIDDDRLHIMMLRLGLYECTARERVETIRRLKRKIGSAK